MIGASTKEYDYVILGAGMAGLGLGYRLALAGQSVLVLEKDSVVGGLAKTLDINGFQFDYCAHRFHSPDPALMQHVRDLMAENFSAHQQTRRIHMFGKYLKYPFELQNLLRGMPVIKAARCGFDFFLNMLRRKKNVTSFANYRDWFQYYFGTQLYRVMCEPYTSKIWGVDPSLISADWADQRFQGPNIRKLLKKVVHKILTLDFTSFSLEDESLAPDSGTFYYPKTGGIQAMPERLAQVMIQKGGEVRTSAIITKIHPRERVVLFQKGEGAEPESARARKALITTIPLHSYINLLDEKVPANVQSSLSELKYMDIIFVLLFIKKPSISNDTWLYFPNPEVAFNRAVEFKNWSPSMAPADQTSLCLDITVTPANQALCTLSKEDLAKKCIADCELLGLCAKEDVFDSRVIYVPFAYPVYDLQYRDKVQSIVGYIESFPEIYCIGRTGIFRYQNSDGALDMAFKMADRLLDPACTHKSLLEYSMKGVSY